MKEKDIIFLSNVCKIPKKYINLELSDMDCIDSDYSNRIKLFNKIGESILRECKFLNEPIFYVLKGKYGTGKTRIATWLVKQAYLGMKDKWFRSDVEIRPLFIRACNLGKYRFEPIKPESDDDFDKVDMRKRVLQSRFVVIDDIGRISDYKGEREFLEQVIEERFDEGLSTVITCNIDPKEISERFEDFISMFKIFSLNSKSRKERNIE